MYKALEGDVAQNICLMVIFTKIIYEMQLLMYLEQIKPYVKPY